jgi:hypothetical protein
MVSPIQLTSSFNTLSTECRGHTLRMSVVCGVALMRPGVERERATDFPIALHGRAVICFPR